MTRIRLSIIPSLIFFSATTFAMRFSNSYVSFELPQNWKCIREGTETVCTSQYSKKAKEAIIILTAKEVGPRDNYKEYLAHLKTPKTILDKQSKPMPSKVLHVRERNIGKHRWVDGMHLGAEVSSYYTRYLVTLKERIAILVTFSAHKAHYTKYSKDFFRAVESLTVTATKDLLRNRPDLNIRGSNSGQIGAPIGQILPQHAIQDEIPVENTSFLGKYGGTILGLFLIIIAIGLYAYFKIDAPTTKNKKKQSPKK